MTKSTKINQSNEINAKKKSYVYQYSDLALSIFLLPRVHVQQLGSTCLGCAENRQRHLESFFCKVFNKFEIETLAIDSNPLTIARHRFTMQIRCQTSRLLMFVINHRQTHFSGVSSHILNDPDYSRLLQRILGSESSESAI